MRGCGLVNIEKQGDLLQILKTNQTRHISLLALNVSKGVLCWLLYRKFVQVYANIKARFFVKNKSLETQRVEYPLPHNLVGKISSLLHGHSADD